MCVTVCGCGCVCVCVQLEISLTGRRCCSESAVVVVSSTGRCGTAGILHTAGSDGGGV